MNFLSLGHYFALKRISVFNLIDFLSYLDCSHYLTETQGVLRKRHQDSELPQCGLRVVYS
jgi:hypothetical protein